MKPVKDRIINDKAHNPFANPAKSSELGIANQTKPGAPNGCMSTGGWK